MPFPRVKLNDGTPIPGIGYGTGTAWYGATGPDGVSRPLVDSLKAALKSGFRHIDAAEMYANEASVGVALQEAGVPREEIYLTTKVLSGVNNLEGSLRNQLKLLKVSYVDLYLIHSPMFVDRISEGYPTLQEAWRQMERLKELGLTKSIGVSNYRVKDLEETLKTAKVVPAVNQIEYHPYVLQQAEDIRNFCAEKGIVIEAYGPSVPAVKKAGGPLDPVLSKISQSLSARGNTEVTPVQVLLKYAQQKGCVVITTTSKEFRMLEQLKVAELPGLAPEEVQEVEKVGGSVLERAYMPHMSKL